MGYKELAFGIEQDLIDRVAGLLWEAGTLGFEIDDSAGKSRVLIRAYFDDSTDLAAVASTLDELDPGLAVHDRVVREDDWPDKWKQYFTGGCVGRKFVVVPPWEITSAVTYPDRTRIIIEPANAFGTGQHTTTALCLGGIEAVPLQGLDCLDLGTGSGILSIAATKLGAGSVTAIDCDPEIVGNYRKNMALNGLARTVPLVVGTLDCLKGANFDLVVANITFNTINASAPALKSLTARRKGRLILSGFLEEDVIQVCRAYQGSAQAVTRTRVRNGWGAVDIRFG